MLASVYNAYTTFPQALLSVEIKDVFDILVVAILTYLVLIFIKQTRSFFIFNSVVFLLLVTYFARQFDLSLTRQLFQPLLTFFFVIFVVVFQREIRRFFDWFFLSGRHLSIQRRISVSSEVSSAIVKAVETMAERRMGAIIVLPGEYPLDDLMEGGQTLDGKVSVPVLLSIFDSSTPGHDGAVLIQSNRIKKFGLHLPLAEDFKAYSKFGTRHRAAAGITERTDAIAIVVSEEKGTISLAEGGALRAVRDMEELGTTLKDFMKENIIDSMPGFSHYFFLNNALTKVASLVIAVALWFIFVYQTGVVTQNFSIPVEFRFLPKEYLLEEVRPQEITVTLAGKQTDFQTLDGRQLKAAVDLSLVEEGSQALVLGDSNITFPSYLELTQISPQQIEIVVKKQVIETADTEVSP